MCSIRTQQLAQVSECKFHSLTTSNRTSASTLPHALPTPSDSPVHVVNVDARHSIDIPKAGFSLH